jgi:putative membrane-bound dehydrogenase-like protein
MNMLDRHRLALMIIFGSILTASARAQAPGTGPRSPREELAAFELADPALKIELVAAEPEVASPVSIAWDEDGRLYVAEMIDYPVAPVAGRIRLLEDRDGDGRYEHAAVFAQGLPFPNSVLPCFGGVLVTAAPHIWFFRDGDGDGRAEERVVVLSGFGEGNTQLRVNGLAWGLDNFIYAANGRSDGEVRAPGDPHSRAVSIRHRDVRFKLSGRPGPGARVEVEAIAGFSQFGLAHDDWGNRFPSWNTIPLRHVVLEEESLARNPYLAETSSVASILDAGDGGRIYAISPPQARFNRESVAFFNASCGPAIERGDLLPASYHGNAFVCEPLTNLVHRRILEPAGVTFLARRAEQGREFLASSDPAFRPVNLATGPDGALYVVDMYRELVEHPEFVPEPARSTVDFRRWHDRGRIWRIGPKAVTAESGPRPRLSQASTRELVALLEHPNGWCRLTAQRLLVERQEGLAVPLLKAALRERSNALGRLHAIWALAGLGAADAVSLAELARDPHPGLREHALRVAAALQLRQQARLIPTECLIALAGDPAIRVRFQAALALGARCREEPAALSAMASIAAQDASDPWMGLAIASGLADSALAFIPLCAQITPSAGRSELLVRAAAIVGARRRTSELTTLLKGIASECEERARPGADRAVSIDALTLLAGLAEGLERSGAPLHALVTAPPRELKSLLARLAPMWSSAAALAASEQPVLQRLLALDVLARGRPELAEDVIPRLLAVTQPRAVQTASARAVASTGRPALAAAVLARWSDLALFVRRELAGAFAESPALRDVLFEAILRQTIGPGDLDAAARQTLARLPDTPLKARALASLARFAPPPRSQILARYQGALKLPGEAGRGASVFARECQICHQHQGQGYRVGPDLSGIAGRAPEALLDDILDPNREVAPDYATLTVATRDGRVFTGLLAEETSTTVKLRRAEGVEDLLLRTQIDALQATGKSLMPEGLEQSLGLQDVADLIAFLRHGGKAVGHGSANQPR